MKLKVATAIGLLAASSAFAGPLLINFETVTSFASINNFYNAGTDSAGATGPTLGVSFTPGALGLQNDAAGPYFSGAPSPLGVMAPVDADATLNLAAGFTTSVSFFYTSAAAITNAVQVWSGLNGGGTLLASFNLAANATQGCSDTAFCHFDALTASFAGTGRSITFGNAAGFAAFDNIALNKVPEPTSLALASLAFAGLLAVRRRA